MKRMFWIILVLCLLVLFACARAEETVELTDIAEETVRIQVYNAQPDLSGAEILSGDAYLEDVPVVRGASPSVSVDGAVITVSNQGNTEHTLPVTIPLGAGAFARVNLTVRNINVDMDVNALLMSGAIGGAALAPSAMMINAPGLGKTVLNATGVLAAHAAPRVHIDFDYDYSIEYYVGNSSEDNTVITNIKESINTIALHFPIYGPVRGSIYGRISIDGFGYVHVEMGVRNNRIDVDYHIDEGFSDASHVGDPYAETSIVAQINAECKLCVSIGLIDREKGSQLLKVFELGYGINLSTEFREDDVIEYPMVYSCRNVDLETSMALEAWAGVGFTYSISAIRPVSPGDGAAWEGASVDDMINARFNLGDELNGTWFGYGGWSVDNVEFTLNGTETSIGVNATLWSREAPDIVIGGRTIRLNGSLHYELNNGQWEYVDECTHGTRLIFDFQIPGEEPVVHYYKFGDHASAFPVPYRPGYAFTGWRDADTGEAFYEYGEVSWTGPKTLIAQYEPEEITPVSYSMDSQTAGYVIGNCESPKELDDGTKVYIVDIHNRYDGQALAESYMAGHPDNGPWYGYPFYFYNGENSSISGVCYGSRVIGSTGMSGSANLTSVTASEGIRWLGTYTNCISLASIYFPDSVETTEARQFRHCTSLSDVRLSPGITHIAPEAFMECTSLAQIDLPSCVDRIEADAFAKSALETVTLPASLGYIGEGAFRDCQNLTTVSTDGTIPLWEIGDRAFAGCTALESVNITSNSTVSFSGSSNAFGGTPALQAVTITAQSIVTAYYTGAFADSGVRELTINTDYLDDFRVQGAHKLETLVINTGHIGELSITDCESLRCLEIHCAGLDCLQLSGCFDSLESVVIDTERPVNEVRTYYAASFPRLTDFVIGGDVGTLSLYNCYSLTRLETGAVTENLYLTNLLSLEELTLPEGTNTINAYSAFRNCIMLREVVIPPSTQVIYEQYSPIRFVRRASSVSTAETFVLRFESVFGEEWESMLLPGGAEVRLPVPSREGFDFGGWYLDAALTQPAGDGLYVMPAAPTALYAAWTAGATGDGLTGDGDTLTGSGDNNLLSVPAQYTTLAPDSVGPGVRTVFIPQTVTRIEAGAFRRATGLEHIVVAVGHPVYYTEGGALYSRTGELVAVPCCLRAESLAIPDGVTSIAAHAMDYDSETGRLLALLIPDSVTEVCEAAFAGLDPACALYGPADGPVRAAALDTGLGYNAFMVYLVSDGQIAAATALSAGELIPGWELEDGSRVFLGWSETADGNLIPADYVIPYGGAVLYAVWDDDGIAVDSEHFPDDAFRAFITEYADWNKDGFLSAEEINGTTMCWLSVPEEQVEEGNFSAEDAEHINTQYRDRITSLQGIAYLSALEHLNMDAMPLLTGPLDLSGNRCLKNVEAIGCALTGLNISGCAALEYLSVDHTPVGTVDVSSLVNLKFLGLTDTGAKTMDVRSNLLLEELACAENGLTALDVTHNASLKYLYCANNLLTTIDLSGNPQLLIFSAAANHLKSLDATACTQMEELFAFDNHLTSVNVHGLIALRQLELSSNQLTELDVSGLTVLDTLYCGDNMLTSLDVSGNSHLVSLIAPINRITSLCLSANIEYLNIYDNPLYAVDLSACPKLIQAVNDGEFETDNQQLDIYAYVQGDVWYAAVVPFGAVPLTNGEACSLMVLPSSLTTIEEEAFAGVVADVIVVPASCTTIGSRAFANCPNLKTIYIPSNAILADDALANCVNVRVVRRE